MCFLLQRLFEYILMKLRQQNLQHLTGNVLDVLVVGGGINGAVSAAALAARGASVGLIDARDFAGFTSQQSSNLIWGGIKYLESNEFKLVAGLCKARNTLIKRYPSAVQEIRFLTTIPQGFRHHPRMVWMGAWSYWLFGRGFTQIPRYLSPARLKMAQPAIDTAECRGGVEYSDAYLQDNDARFVFNFIRGAMDNGCKAVNYLAASGAAQNNDGTWTVKVKDGLNGEVFEIRSRSVVNAAGAFVDEFNASSGIDTQYRHAFSKGVHLIVPKITKGKRVLAFFADDGRLFFAIPMGNRTCIGTTDTPVLDPLTHVTESDRDFILNNINARLDLPKALSRDDIIAERCGVRPLAIENGVETEEDFLQLSRKHVIEVSPDQTYLSIFGGKLTDCLNVGDAVCEQVADMGIALQFDGPDWYGEPAQLQYDIYRGRGITMSLDKIKLEDTGESLLLRLWRRYGMYAHEMLDRIEQDPLQAQPVIKGSGLYRCEIQHLANKEMISSLQDLFHRRTKIALVTPRETLRTSDGTMMLCRALFGDAAQAQYDVYFNDQQTGTDHGA